MSTTLSKKSGHYFDYEGEERCHWCSETNVCLKHRVALVQESYGAPVTLDGETALVNRYADPRIAIVRSAVKSVEFSWPTVRRILHSHRSFKS